MFKRPEYESTIPDAVLQGAFALEDALDRGKPLEEEVRLLAAAVGEKDPLVMAALSSLPPNVAQQGPPTKAQLQEQVRMAGTMLVGF